MRDDEVIDSLRARHADLSARVDELSAVVSEARAGASRADACLLDATTDRLRGILRTIDNGFDACIRAENEHVFPDILMTVPAAVGSIHPLLDEHTELHEMIARLLSTLNEPHSEERDEQIVVQVRDVVDLFRIHMRKEESVVYRLRDQILSRRGPEHGGPHETKGPLS